MKVKNRTLAILSVLLVLMPINAIAHEPEMPDPIDACALIVGGCDPEMPDPIDACALIVGGCDPEMPDPIDACALIVGGCDQYPIDPPCISIVGGCDQYPIDPPCISIVGGCDPEMPYPIEPPIWIPPVPTPDMWTTNIENIETIESGMISWF